MDEYPGSYSALLDGNAHSDGTIALAHFADGEGERHVIGDVRAR